MAVINCEYVQMSVSDMQSVCKQSRPEHHDVTQYTHMLVVTTNNEALLFTKCRDNNIIRSILNLFNGYKRRRAATADDTFTDLAEDVAFNLTAR